MREIGINPSVIRAGKANMFLSPVFTEAFVNTTNVPVELYENDGSVGAALGAGIGSKVFSSEQEAFTNTKPVALIQPSKQDIYEPIYQDWKQVLQKHLKK
jgi:xylulokinase